MSRTRLVRNALVSFVVFLMFSPFAHAQATRTWVSGVGDDANPCSRTAPCKTFAGAISKTAAAGEINVLDPGGFGAVTITKSITIRADHVEAGVLVSGTNAIVVNVAATDTVVLEGLDIEGLGTGLNGINIVGGGKTLIRKCSIRNFTQNGINVQGTLGARAVIEDTLIAHNHGGVNLQTSGGGTIVRNSVIDNNTSFATQAADTSTLVLIGSLLSGSPSAIVTSGTAVVQSYGNNVIRGTGTPTQTLPLQ